MNGKVKLDPTTKSASAIITDDLTIENGLAKADTPESKGRLYFEAKYLINSYNIIGVCLDSFDSKTYSMPQLSPSINMWTYEATRGYMQYNNAYNHLYGDSIGNIPCILGVGLDLDLGEIEFFIDGISQGIAFITIPTGVEIYPLIGLNSGSKAILNFGDTDFEFGLPNGYRAWQDSIKNKSLILHDGEYKRYTHKIDAHFIKRSKTGFTSNTFDSDIVTTSSSFSSSRDGWCAFDGDITGGTSWSTAVGVTQAWLKYSFASSTRLNKYIIRGNIDSTYSSRNPKNWTFEGSNNDTDWDILDTRENTVFGFSERKEFVFNNSIKYKHYRLNILENNGDSGHIQIDEIEFLEFIPYQKEEWTTISSTLPTSTQFLEQGMDNLSPLLDRKVTELESITMEDKSEMLGENATGKVFGKTIDLNKYFDIRYIGIKEYTTGSLTLKADDKYRIVTIDKKRKNLNMTSNTAPSPLVASASGTIHTLFNPYRAFDGSTTGSNIGWGVSTRSGWLQIDFGKKTNICGFTLHSGKNGGYYLHDSSPRNFKLIGSYDGIEWKDINEYITTWVGNNANNISKKFECNYVNYRYYRLVINSTNSTNIYVGEMFFEEFELKMNEYPLSNSNLLEATSNNILFSLLFDKKNYILQNTVSENEEGLWTTQLNKKPLSISFN
ncbi:discoidin domain-containing protein [Metasolibacillus meyeri]|uniref:discoidin domain-containing protein n=1 Tax=Metasolibacillus meyeri TaxID=1071052 RepID=UPI000D30BD86|nr:discoidin domain-containing protein [Metasolibacillus meyeri]